MDEPGSHEDRKIVDTIWKYSGWFVLLLLTFGAGVGIAYNQWGDAIQLRKEVAGLEQQLHKARGERENKAFQISRLEGENKRLRRKISELEEAASAGTAEGAEAAEE